MYVFTCTVSVLWDGCDSYAPPTAWGAAWGYSRAYMPALAHLAQERCNYRLTSAAHAPRAGPRGSMEEPEREVLAGIGLDRPQPPPPGRPAAAAAGPGVGAGAGQPVHGSASGALPGPPALPAAALKLVKKAQKKAVKEARKVQNTIGAPFLLYSYSSFACLASFIPWWPWVWHARDKFNVRKACQCNNVHA